jgi:hypothetical protein
MNETGKARSSPLGFVIEADGFAAGAAGDPAASNPYDKGTQAYRLCLEGWQEGRGRRIPDSRA